MSKVDRFYFKELRLQQFRGLVALGTFRTFSAAASALKLTRATVWQQVHSLEQELGINLVHLQKHKVEVTREGRQLIGMITPLVTGFDSVKAAFLANQDSIPQTLSIVTASTFIVYELPEILAQVHTLYPKLQLTLMERNSPLAVEILEQGSADMAIVTWPDNLPKRPSLEYMPLTAYPFMLICPPNHELLTKSKLTLRDLTRYPLILPGNGTFCRKQFDTVLGLAGLLDKLNIVLESNFPLVHFEYVRVGMGIAIDPLPPELCEKAKLPNSGYALRPLGRLFKADPVYYVRRKGEFERPYVAKLRELLMAKHLMHAPKKTGKAALLGESVWSNGMEPGLQSKLAG
jgi:DNA-binding transcriptional LysR family regulator